jgi:hypothetical protein
MYTPFTLNPGVALVLMVRRAVRGAAAEAARTAAVRPRVENIVVAVAS